MTVKCYNKLLKQSNDWITINGCFFCVFNWSVYIFERTILCPRYIPIVTKVKCLMCCIFCSDHLCCNWLVNRHSNSNTNSSQLQQDRIYWMHSMAVVLIYWVILFMIFCTTEPRYMGISYLIWFLQNPNKQTQQQIFPDRNNCDR